MILIYVMVPVEKEKLLRRMYSKIIDIFRVFGSGFMTSFSSLFSFVKVDDIKLNELGISFQLYFSGIL